MNGISPELICIGNPIVDVFAAGSGELILRYGLEKEAQHIPIETLREILPRLSGASLCSGGGAANVAKISGLLGISTGFAGSVGRDSEGELFEKELNGAGVITSLTGAEEPTGMCLVLKMPDGKVKIAAAPSASLSLSGEDIREDLIRSAKVVVLDGFMLGRESLVRRVLAVAGEYGTVAALDLSSPLLAAEKAHEILTYSRIYPLVLFMNEHEAVSFYRTLSQSRDEIPALGENGQMREELTDLFRELTSHDIFPIIVIKLGKRGAVVFAGGNVHREGTIQINSSETTGAGDAFCAGFLAAWIKDKPLSACAAFGNRTAREVLNVNGSRADPKALRKLGKQIGN